MRRKREPGSAGDNGGTHTCTGHVQTQAKIEVYVRTHTLNQTSTHAGSVDNYNEAKYNMKKEKQRDQKRKKTTQGNCNIKAQNLIKIKTADLISFSQH